MPATTTKKPHVLIIGAGLGGLALAQALRKQGVTFEIFERDQGLHARFQGWAIALHFIIQDLRSSLPDDLPPLETTSHLQPLNLAPEMTMYDKDGSVARIEGMSDSSLIRANRSRLRDWLATNLEINWDMHITSIEEHGDSVTARFADGMSATGDVLVGADGVHSFVRDHLLGKDRLRTVPYGFIVGEPTLDKVQYERQLALAHSAYVGLSHQKSNPSRIFVGLNSVADDALSAKYYWIYCWPDAAAAHEPFWTHDRSKQELYDYAQKHVHEALDPALTEIVRLTNVEDISTPPIVMRDMILTEMPNGRVTLLGDAAHPMTPFRGEGGNNAVRDSLNLARSLTKSTPETLLQELKVYQNEMLERGSTAVKNSRAATEDSTGGGTREAWKTWREKNLEQEGAGKA